MLVIIWRQYGYDRVRIKPPSTCYTYIIGHKSSVHLQSVLIDGYFDPYQSLRKIFYKLTGIIRVSVIDLILIYF